MNSINIKNVSKSYTIKKKNIGKGFFKKTTKEKFFALSKINLKIEKGECIGIIGRNGSGKTTLLKLIGNIITPTSGLITIKGKILCFLDLSTGFEDHLTGRENIYLYSSLIGIPKKIVDQKIDEIITFSELQDFIDINIEKYSNGMKARLAFSTVFCYNPDIILLDEIISVGDELFQKKSIEKIKSMKKLNKTILIVSHVMELLIDVCDKIVYLDSGKIQLFDSTKNAISKYLNDNPIDKSDQLDTIESQFRKIILIESKLKKKTSENFLEKVVSELDVTKNTQSLNETLTNLKEKTKVSIRKNDCLNSKKIQILESKLYFEYNENIKKELIELIENQLRLFIIFQKITDNKNEMIKYVERKNRYVDKLSKYGYLSNSVMLEKKLENAMNRFLLYKNQYEKTPAMTEIIFFSAKIDLTNIIDKQLLDSIHDLDKLSKLRPNKIIYLKEILDDAIILSSIKVNELESQLKKFFSLLDEFSKTKTNMIEIRQTLINSIQSIMTYKSHNLLVSGSFVHLFLRLFEKQQIKLKDSEISELNTFISSWSYDIDILTREILNKKINTNDVGNQMSSLSKLNNIKNSLQNKINVYLKKEKKNGFSIKNIKIDGKKIISKDVFNSNDDISFKILISKNKELKSKKVFIDILLYSENEILISKFSSSINNMTTPINDKWITCKVNVKPLKSGLYYIDLIVKDNENKIFDTLKKAYFFTIKNQNNSNDGLIILDSKWDI